MHVGSTQAKQFGRTSRPSAKACAQVRWVLCAEAAARRFYASCERNPSQMAQFLAIRHLPSVRLRLRVSLWSWSQFQE